MEIKSIEQRAIEHFPKHSDEEFDMEFMRPSRELYIQAATEQDQISRADERERCIKAAQEWNCSSCGFSKNCKIDNDEVGHCIYMPNDKCMDRVNIRKAIEEVRDE